MINVQQPKKVYDKISLLISSGVIAQIFKMGLSSIGDFSGVFLGNHKISTIKQPTDDNSNSRIEILDLCIEKNIFIYDKEYMDAKLERLLDRIKSMYAPYQILGIFTYKSNSQPIMSLKEQQFYFKTNKYYTENYFHGHDVPLIFGAFSSGEKNDETKAKSFLSRFFYIDNNRKQFSLPYQMTNLKETSYADLINSTATFTVLKAANPEEEIVSFEKEGVVPMLKNLIREQERKIEEELQPQISQVQEDLKRELENYVGLYNQYKAYKK